MITPAPAVTAKSAAYPVFSAHSPYAQSILSLSDGVLWAMLGILLIVVGLVAYCRFKFKYRPGDAMPKPVYGNVKLELSYTIAFVIILGTISWFSLEAMHASDPPSNKAPDLVVVAHQWWWELRYPHQGFASANEIHIPINTPIRLGLRSADVIHDLWVPELGRKMDIIPGLENHTWFSASEPGTYYGRCAEFCGAEHAWMRVRVIAQTPADYAKWVNAQQMVPAKPTDGLALKGAQDFESMSCANCHEIRGTAAHARIGPDLTHVASRETIAAGRLANTPENLHLWLKEPDLVKPRCKMPNLHLPREQNDELVAYLETLK